MTTTGPRTTLRRLAAIGGGLLGVAALAGCAPTASDAAPASSAPAASAPSSAASAGTSSGDLKDGSYTATGHYQSPGGDSAVEVTVTLKSGTISAVKVVPKAADPTAQQYEAQSASGISGVAVGKRIDGLQVGAVSGSSLTSQGFEKALAEIRTEAAA
ncbi:FMN-binding protein [Amnibacterium kyonggiense]|uniref:Uncharacterized protein with FMN-binding domain n=1 Tax=Amnibacterium kyonggiense TaxID=595671 RepID=A0A4R7FL74_9MICO|nr:FMN-binding protein [Amnibacterium kyonggiense]TDS77152.1 uncharacterized protein with FMN-binding domain [Amnibacterium kyonggiense]